MRKLLLTTAAVAAAICLAGCGKKESVPETPNTFTDTRDGQTYKTVKIGKQTWMAQNLNYQTDSSWCYENSTDSCNKYGRLYNWNAAKKACPTGWKLPDTADWNRLVTAVGGKETAGRKLKAKSEWNTNGNGTDNHGFSALPGGFSFSCCAFILAGDVGFWWTATPSEYSSDKADDRSMCDIYDDVDENDNDKNSGHSVRCVADRP